jgi:phosphate uptake regulator
MERKLVKQGRNALTVTLPASWLKERGFKAGDIINLEERNNELVISSGLKRKKSSITLDAKDYELNMINHKVMGAYVEGFDEIVVLNNKEGDITRIARMLLGFVIEERNIEKTILKSIVDLPEDNFNIVLRRAALILTQVAVKTEEVALGKASRGEVADEEDLLDHNLFYCLRYLNKYENSEKSYKYFLLCANLEAAGDQLKDISKYIKGKKELGKIVRECVDDYVRFIFKEDFQGLYKSLRSYRNKINGKGFVDGLVFAFIEGLYNNIGIWLTKNNAFSQGLERDYGIF